MNLRTVVSKLSKRARLFLTPIVPFQSRYRPSGVTLLRSLPSGSMIYQEINPPYTSKLALSDEFVSACSPWLKPLMSRDFEADYVAILKNARVYAHDPNNIALISEDNLLVEDASFQWNGQEWLTGDLNKVFQLKGYVSPLKLKGKVCSLLSTGSVKYYYYYWLNDMLPKILLLKRAGEFDKIDYFMVPNYQLRYQREYLDHFGIPKHKIIVEDEHPHVQADELVITSFIGKRNHYPQWGMRFIHDSLCSPLDLSHDKLIYISRADASVNRPVLNEEELISLLKSYGFEILELTKLSVHEQVGIFNSAKAVVGAHGAGLANLMFCKPGTSVLELFPSNYVRHGYHDIANKMDLNYHYILCDPDRESHDHNTGQRVGLTVPIPEVTAMIQKLLQLT